MGIRILLADDHKMVVDGLTTLLSKQASFDVLGFSLNGQETVQKALALRPDVIVMDINMPLVNGIEATRKVLSELPNTKIVILSMHSEKVFITEALKAGAKGFVLKDAAFDELIRAIQTVMNGKTFLSASITDRVVEDYLGKLQNETTDNFSILSPREREVLQRLSEGQSTKDMALALGVSVKTIETYRQQLMEKLDLHSVAELTKYAIREGLTKL